jgi:hypothetical protein
MGDQQWAGDKIAVFCVSRSVEKKKRTVTLSATLVVVGGGVGAGKPPSVSFSETKMACNVGQTIMQQGKGR